MKNQIYWTYVQWEAVQVARNYGFNVPVVVKNYCYMGLHKDTTKAMDF